MRFNSKIFLLIIIAVLLFQSCEESTSAGDSEAPSITLEYPAEWGNSISGIVEITAIAEDNQAVAKVEFFVLGNDTPNFIDDEAPYIWVLDSESLPNCGFSTLYAVAEDAAGIRTDSNYHMFLVENSTQTGQTVQMFLTEANGSAKLEAQPNIFFGEFCETQNVIFVDDSQVFQEIDGFGAALTHSSAYLIDNSPFRDEIIEALFCPENGIGINATRLCIGASDFSHDGHFSYAETPGDTVLNDFSIAIDYEDVIPVLLDALEYQPNLHIMASPWSAPGWMKTSGSMIGGELKYMYYDTYANYFLKYIQAYESAGIALHAITVQNEPGYIPWNYPGMGMDAIAQKNFVANSLGPILHGADYPVDILVFDHNWGWDPDFTSGADYVLTIFDDATANQYDTGSAWHGYGGDVVAQSIVHDAYPEKDVFFTERTNSALWEGWDGVMGHMGEYYFIDVLHNWSRNVLLWNLALDSNYGPYAGGCDNCTGVVTVDPDHWQQEIDYWLSGHFSKFVKRGAHRIGSWEEIDGLEAVAFQNPDGQFVLVALNTSYSNESLEVEHDGERFVFSLPGQGIATFLWE